jgi:hypothetical protein
MAILFMDLLHQISTKFKFHIRSYNPFSNLAVEDLFFLLILRIQQNKILCLLNDLLLILFIPGKSMGFKKLSYAWNVIFPPFLP